MAFEFLQAFARFYVDRQAYDETLKKMESDAAAASARIEKALAVQAGSPEFGAVSIGDLRTRSAATQQVSDAIDTHNKKQKEQSASALEVARSVREVSRGLASELSPALGGAVSGFVSGAQAARAFGVGVGVVVGGLTLASEIIGAYIQRLKAAQEAQVALNVAKLAEDFGAVEAQVKASITELARFDEQRKVIVNGAELLLPSVQTDFGQLLQENEGELRARAEARSKAAAEVFERLEVPRRVIETNLALIGIEKEAARQEAERATTVEAVNAALAKQIDVTNRQAALTAEQTRAAGRTEGQRLINEGVRVGNAQLVAQGRFIAEEAGKRADAQIAAAKLASDETTRIATRRNAEIEASEIDFQARAADRDRARAALARDVAGQILDIEAAANAQRVESEGTVNDRIEEFFARRRELVQRQVDEDIAAINKTTELQKQALQTRIAAAQGDERVQLERQLTELVAKAEDDRQRIRENALVRTLQLDQQETAAKKAELDRRRQLDQSYFDALKAAGYASAQDEIARQVQLVRQTEIGTIDRLNAEKKLIEQVNALRAQQQQVASGIMGLVQKRLEEQGLTEFSLQDVQQALDDVRNAARENAASFLMGGRITREQFGEIQGVTGLNQQLGQLGQTPDQALQGAVGQIFTAGQPMGTPLESTFQTSLESVDKFMADFKKKIEEGSSIIADTLFQNFSERFTRKLENEARRL